MIEVIKDNDFYYVKCPHCLEEIMVHKNDINCRIFRHGVYKKNYKQIDPHLNKKECDRLFIEKKIYGCGKPFEIIEENKKYYTITCNYK